MQKIQDTSNYVLDNNHFVTGLNSAGQYDNSQWKKKCL